MRNPLQRLSTRHALVFIVVSLNQVATVGAIRISSIDGLANPYEVAIDGEDIHLLAQRIIRSFLFPKGLILLVISVLAVGIRCFKSIRSFEKEQKVRLKKSKNSLTFETVKKFV